MKPVYIGKKKGYLVNDVLYRTKKDLVDAVRAILHAYDAGSKVSKNHYDFLFDLLSFHPEADEKISSGILSFEVRSVPSYEHVKGFWAIRKDGEEIPWSYTKVIYPPKPFTLFRKVCRAVIADQMVDFKSNWFKNNAKQGCFICSITGETFPAERAHVDHEPPHTLDALVRAFIKKKNIDVSKVSLPETKDTGIGYYFSDITLCKEWQLYHQKHAKLRVISDVANLSHVKKSKK